MAAIHEPLVLLPGHLCDEGMWEAQVRDLAPLVASVHVILAGPQSSMAELADAVEASLPPGRFALAGFSLGGMIAMELMERMPERISRLALLDTSARSADPHEAPMSLANLKRAEEGEVEAVVREFVDFLSAPEVKTGRPHVVQETVEMMVRRAVECYAPQQAAIIARPDRRDALPRIACPTLILHGELELIAPAAVHQEMADLIPGARLVSVPGASHMSTTEQPEAVSAALREWLAM